jgi:TPR repeat protein
MRLPWWMGLCVVAAVGCGAPATPPAATPTSATTEPGARDPDTDEPDWDRITAELVARCEGVDGVAESYVDAAIACQMLATFQAEGIGKHRPDPPGAGTNPLWRRAHHWLLTGCERGDVDACAMMGNLNAIKLSSLEPRSPQAKEWADATVPLVRRACRAERWDSCVILADIHQHGRGVAPDRERARGLYQQSCDHDVALGCVGQAQLLVEQGGGRGAIDRLLGRACELGNVEACQQTPLSAKARHVMPAPRGPF